MNGYSVESKAFHGKVPPTMELGGTHFEILYAKLRDKGLEKKFEGLIDSVLRMNWGKRNNFSNWSCSHNFPIMEPQKATMTTQIERTEEEEISRMESGFGKGSSAGQFKFSERFCASPAIVTLGQKVVAELIGTYFVIFAGCGSVAVNNIYGSVTFPGICVTWGLIVMVMVYTVGHISGAHFNPAVTLTSALLRRFPWKEVPFYWIAQFGGSLLASCTLSFMMNVTTESYFGTLPVGSNGQSLAAEIIISFLLMFVISGVSSDSRAIGELAGVAVGMTIMLNVFVAGPISGASMNPARSLGPAIVRNEYKGIWVYIVGPVVGTIGGGFAYNLIRLTDKPIRELTKSESFLGNANSDSN